MTEMLLRRLVRSILSEGRPPPDEPSVAPDDALGQYVFPGDRTDPSYKEVIEKNTELEDEFYRALVDHYDQNDNTALRQIWPEVIGLARSGMYPKLLVPPPGLAFRVMTVDPVRCAGLLGLSVEEIKAHEGAAQRVGSPPAYTPRDFISSWTLNPEIMVAYTGSQFIPYKAGHCAVLLVTETSRGEFMMNPETFARGWNLGSYYQSEHEIISGGPVGLKSAAWLWHGESPRGRKMAMGILGELLAAVEE